jgi:hypothetical protein
MSVLIPLQPSIPNYRVGTALEGVQYTLDVRWNGRDEAWYLDLLLEDETPVVHGLKLVLGAAIGSGITNPDFPPGVFVCRDLSNEGRDAGLDDMGTRVVVYFFPHSERTTS